jgi:uncharacterized protein
MIEVPADRCERHRLFKAIDDAFRVGDFKALDDVLGGSRWFDEEMPVELGLGHPLEYAIYWGPIAFIEALIDAGSNPNYLDAGGFPAIMATLSTSRCDKLDVLTFLLQKGADPNARGVNDWTPLHFAVSLGDADAIKLLLAWGADPTLRTRIDDCDTALEGAEAAGFEAGATLLRAGIAARRDASRAN